MPIMRKWHNSPTFTSIKTTNFPVWEIPFPGVTVCSNIVVEDNQLTKVLYTPGWIELQDGLNMSYDEADTMVYRSLDVISASLTTNVPFFESANLNARTLDFMDKYRDNVTGIMRKVTKKSKKIRCVAYLQ